MSGNWVRACNGCVPTGAVIAGVDVDGKAMYVARAKHESYLVPGKLVATHGNAFIPWYGKEIAKMEYEVLVNGPNRWVPCSGTNIPCNAVAGGMEENNTTMYIGRARIDGSLTVGKVHSSYGCIYLSYGGLEHRFNEYEILVNDTVEGKCCHNHCLSNTHIHVIAIAPSSSLPAAISQCHMLNQ
ncbi:natterin-4-like [Anticarsia gemmatalis]|uniref:natterin-4-like n=1 Tax=Anticarsia gemmatalis TaxID=129554 RepID=UPI003F771107